MVALYAARLKDLGPGDLVQLECACGHAMVLTPAMLATAGVRSAKKIVDLESRLRCRECDARGKAGDRGVPAPRRHRECDARGKAVVSIKWGGR
jgi:hypothetical protein